MQKKIWIPVFVGMTNKKYSVLVNVNPCLTKCNLKKQSQFDYIISSVNSYIKRDYSNYINDRTSRIQSQFQMGISLPDKTGGNLWFQTALIVDGRIDFC